MAVSNQTLIAALYTAVFNRAPDQAGLNFWTAQLNAGTPFASIAAGFTQHEVFTTGIGALGNAAYIAALYTNILGSAGDTAGIAYWTARLASGESKASVAAAFVSGSLTIDIPALLATGGISAADAAAAITRQQTLTNKADVGIYFANTLGAASNLGANTVTSSKASLEADPIYKASQAAIANVTSTAASVTDAKSAISGTTTAPSTPATPASPQTFTLTAGTDTFTGGTSDDTFNGDQTTFTAADKLDGGAGKNTLNLTHSGAAIWNMPAATVQNIEVINVRNLNTTAKIDSVTASNFIGATNFNADRATSNVVVANLIAGQQVGVIGDSVTSNAEFYAFYDGSVTSSTLNFSGGTLGTASVTLNGGALSAVTITSSGATNVTGTVDLSSNALTNATINADTNLTLSGIIGFKTAVTNNSLTVAGKASTVTLGTLANTIGVVDASGLTKGGIVATLGSNTGVKFTGGGGNDVVTSSVLLTTGVVDAGAGTDRLILTGNVGASAAQYKGFEELQVTAASQDVSLFTGSTITKLVMSGTSGVSNLSAAQAANIQALASGTYTIGITGASNVLQSDTVHITADDSVATTSTITLANLNMTDIETLQLTAVDNVVASSLTGANALSSVKLDGAGAIGVTTGAVTFAAGSIIDASTATGAVTFNASAALVNGVTIKGGSGNDTLTGTAFADVIAGGAGQNTLTGGAAANTFQFTAGGADFVAIDAATLATSKTVITDWSAGSGNKIDFGATPLAAVAHTALSVPGRATVDNTGHADFDISDNTLARKLTALSSAMGSDAAGTSAVFSDSVNSYVFVSNGIAGIQAGDALIQLTGVTSASGLTFLGGDITGVILPI
jgi:hypothetical protein